jgi:hypothetical protein
MVSKRLPCERLDNSDAVYIIKYIPVGIVDARPVAWYLTIGVIIFDIIIFGNHWTRPGSIAGVAIGAAVLLIFIAVGVYVLGRHHGRQKERIRVEQSGCPARSKTQASRRGGLAAIIRTSD